MLTVNYLQNIAAAHADIIYILIVLGVFLEGEIVVILAGVFSYLGSINIFCAFLATVTGGVIKSVSGYGIGYLLNKNFSHRKIIIEAEQKINIFFPNFLKKPFRSVFLSRFLILGMYWFTLVYSGYKNIKLRTFVWAEATSLFVWAWVMLLLGFFFSHTALLISRDIRNFIIIILTFFVAFLILEKVMTFFVELFGIKVNVNENDEHI